MVATPEPSSELASSSTEVLERPLSAADFRVVEGEGDKQEMLRNQDIKGLHYSAFHYIPQCDSMNPELVLQG